MIEVTLADLVEQARNLSSEMGENPEYDRGLVELVAALLPLPMDDGGREIASMLVLPERKR